MAYTLNTSHALYGNLVELIGVQGGALVSHKTVRTFAPHATSSFVSGSLGAGFKTGVKGWNVNGASLSPTVTIDTNANPNLTVFIAVNNIGTAADICGALTTSTVSFGVNGNTGMGLFDEYNSRGTFKTPTIVNNGAHSLCAKRLGETTAASYVDGVLGSTDSVRLGFTTGAQNILSYIGGYDGQGSCGGIEFVWIAIFNKALSDAEVADLHSSLGGSNAFGLVTGGGGGGGDTTAPGGTGTSTGSGSGGTATGGPTGTGTFTSDAMENNTGAGLLASTTVNWTWYQGTIGAAPTSTTHGTGTTSAGGILSLTGLPVGAGFLLARTADATGVYYQPGTVA